MEFAFGFIPPELGPWAAITVIATAFLSAALTAALGLGGGLILLAVMGSFLPPVAVIPVHGIAQLGSNAGRAILQFRHIVWPVFAAFTAGGVLGAALGGQLAVNMPGWLLKLGVALFIILTLYGPKLRVPPPGPRLFFATGLVGTFLTLFFGATGPIAATVIGAAKFDRFATTATHGACMLAQHGLKVMTFGLLGFAYAPWVPFLAVVLAAGFVGTFLGTRLLRRLPEKTFRTAFRIVLTLIALQLAVAGAREVLTG